MVSRHKYLRSSHVQGFAAYLAKVFRGETFINFTVGFTRNQLYPGFEKRFPGNVEQPAGGRRDEYVVFAKTLEEMFDMYWWNRQDYDANKAELDGVADMIRATSKDDADKERTLEACRQVLEWGLGKGAAYTKNLAWARQFGTMLPSVLHAGREALSCESPNLRVFDCFTEKNRPRMNAGWTKYYALALDGHIIYDGRVGAALGFLVRRYLESLAPVERPSTVPDELHFRWAAGKGSKRRRNPSSGSYQFNALIAGANGSEQWAELNVKANWILAQAAANASMHADNKDQWWSGQDGLRKLEAALFMVGYDLERVNGPKPQAEELRAA